MNEQEMRAAVDNAYEKIGAAIDEIRRELDRPAWWAKVRGYRITAYKPVGPDAAFTFDCKLLLDGRDWGVGLSVECMKDPVLVVDGAEVPFVQFPSLRQRMGR